MIKPERESTGVRWVCHCTQPPILLAIYDQTGRIEIKVGDRYYVARDRLQATCPRCGTQHTLEVHQSSPHPRPLSQCWERGGSGSA